MPANTQTSYVSCNAQADAHGALLNSGYLRIYSGTQRAHSGDSVGASVLLAELRFAATAFAPAVQGVITANDLVAEASAPAAGVAAWFGAFKSDGTTSVYDGNIGTGSEDMLVADVNIPLGAQVSAGALTYAVPRA